MHFAISSKMKSWSGIRLIVGLSEIIRNLLTLTFFSSSYTCIFLFKNFKIFLKVILLKIYFFMWDYEIINWNLILIREEDPNFLTYIFFLYIFFSIYMCTLLLKNLIIYYCYERNIWTFKINILNKEIKN